MKPKLEHDLPLKDDRKEKVLANTISFDPRVGDTIVINVDGSTLIIRRKA